tara:strand:+ start:1273 stop:1797 length:525 start_codon:yes stop_codon:yes gene_type:complete
MATTELHKYSTNERLGKMDVDLITVIPTISTGSTDASGDLLFDALEIPNCVSVNGGRALLHSIGVFHKGDINVSFDIIFFQVTQDLGTAGSPLTWGGSSETTNADNAVLLGHTSITDWTDLVDVHVATKTNIGLVLQAAAGTKSIYCAGICRGAASGDHTTATNIDLRIGVIKD